MILFKRRYCRKYGHALHPDPGDFVLICTRCGAIADMHELWDAYKTLVAAFECPCYLHRHSPMPPNMASPCICECAHELAIPPGQTGTP